MAIERLARQALEDPDSVAAAMVDDYSLRLGDVFVALETVRDDPFPFAVLDTRSANALRKLHCETWGDVADLRVDALWGLPTIGRLSVHRVLTASAKHNAEVAPSAALESKLSPARADPALDEHPPDTVRHIVRRSDGQRLDAILREVAAWAVNERGAERLSDLLALSPDLGTVPPDIRERVAELSALPIGRFIDPATFALSTTLAAEFVEQLGERARPFIDRNLRLHDRPTLAELAGELRVTRERVRQLEQRTLERAKLLRSEARFAPLLWRAIDLAGVLGAAIPVDSETAADALNWAARGLDDPAVCTAPELLLWIAGPYELETGWLIRSDAPSLGALAKSVADKIDTDVWLIDLDTVQRVFADLGIADLEASELAPLLRGWRNQGDDTFVRWAGSVADKAEIVLRLAGIPLPIDEINERIGEGHVLTSLRNSLTGDNRFVRLDKANKFGLREWGLEEYSGIAQEIIQRIQRADAPVELRELIIEFVEEFGVSETSVRLYAACPAFILEDGLVRLRSADEPYLPDDTIAKVRGMYVCASGEVILHLPVTKDTLRGSGRAVPEAFAVHLGIRPGQRCDFHHPATGTTVVVTWSPTSTMGPNIGSLRALVEDLQRPLGDDIRLVLDPSNQTCTAERVDRATLTGLTGLHAEPGREVEVVAAALAVDPLEVRAKLQARGDNEVLSLLPPPSLSDGLDRALVEFGDLLS